MALHFPDTFNQLVELLLNHARFPSFKRIYAPCERLAITPLSADGEWQYFVWRPNKHAGLMAKMAAFQAASLSSVCPGFTRVNDTGFIVIPILPPVSIVTLV